MQIDFINIGLGFLEGFALIISPCILPILPIILAGSLEGSKRRPLGIVFGFVIAFAIFTFFSKQLIQYLGVDLAIIRYISYALLFLLGIIMLSNFLTEKFAYFTQRLVNAGSSIAVANNPQGGFISGIIFGGLVGLIWTPCAGPILAAVIVQTVIQNTSLNSFLIVLAFGLGAGVPMLIIALLGRSVLAKLQVFKRHAYLFRKILGAIIILSVFGMIYSGIYGENISYTATKSTTSEVSHPNLIDGLGQSYPAPPIAGITAWINSPALDLQQLKGKVVLIDFWTYSCINCMRTLPYLKDWYAKYHAQGLEIIGVHTPEFEFEKDINNVKNAVANDGITYPVALDSNFVTWQNYHNSYWPAHYLIDKEGNVVYQHFGEGEYATTENNIRFLLGLNATNHPAQFGDDVSSGRQTPETYLGYARMSHYAGVEPIVNDQTATYSFPLNLTDDQWALQGAWKVGGQQITAMAVDAGIRIHFNARKVFVVMGNATGYPIRVQLMLNGAAVVGEKGKDVVDSSILVGSHGLFEALVFKGAANGILELRALAPGLEVYTFTFGG